MKALRIFAIERQKQRLYFPTWRTPEKELEEKKVYVKTKEFTMEKAREIFGLKLPDEIIIKPDEK